ncbi:hypothetical protein [Streptomyces sp. P17]|uniref:hypothetical protein n=1 Tax=Streptomyces sp. P17 TaxID=3074716 RepID=UPI0028F43A53|nr:hypothetical protein [Streptomyces sp. P17]MDT9694954.1 hypothetical protein [Streptomyces sp. P17]
MNDSPGPGVAWLAERTGKDPSELTASPTAALDTLAQAVREAADLAARAMSDDAEVRKQARAEAAGLRRQYAAAPRPAEALGTRLAARLRTAAEELRRE